MDFSINTFSLLKVIPICTLHIVFHLLNLSPLCTQASVAFDGLPKTCPITSPRGFCFLGRQLPKTGISPIRGVESNQQPTDYQPSCQSFHHFGCVSCKVHCTPQSGRTHIIMARTFLLLAILQCANHKVKVGANAFIIL